MRRSEFVRSDSHVSLSQTSAPHLFIGECKSFNRFGERDFARAAQAASLFPGAVLCFCTFNESLEENEIKGLTRLAQQGRKRMDVGKQTNPVLILTGKELFSDLILGDFYSIYGDKADYARDVALGATSTVWVCPTRSFKRY
jgi:hypothetical protein